MTQPSLKLKTYFSTTVEAAVVLARRELGSEAMLVNSRRTPDEVKHLGNYEVIFATGAPPAPRGIPPVVVRKAVTDTDTQLEDIRNQLAGLRQSMWSSRPESASLSAAPSESSMMRRTLEARGVDPSLSRELLHALNRLEPAPLGKEQFQQALLAEMARRINVDPSVHKEGSPRAVLAFVGPPGRGKSTTLVKLAVTEGLARSIPIRILSLDNYRIGAGEQMRSYGAILGVPFYACGSITELDHHLSTMWGAEARKPSLTLIDTSGYSPSDIEAGTELAAYLLGNPEINVHLVLRADTKCADGLLTVQRYSNFGISKLIFTGMDEVESFGSVFSIAVQSGKPISFLGSGQSIPEDLEPAVSDKFIQLVMEGRQLAVLAAA